MWAYKQLSAGSEALLDQDTLFWTEKLLLSLLRTLSARRIEQLSGVLPLFRTQEDVTVELRESMMESMTEAALGGHELGEWEQVENGYQARCSLCGMSTWLGYEGLRYSILEDECTGAAGHE